MWGDGARGSRTLPSELYWGAGMGHRGHAWGGVPFPVAALSPHEELQVPRDLGVPLSEVGWRGMLGWSSSAWGCGSPDVTHNDRGELRTEQPEAPPVAAICRGTGGLAGRRALSPRAGGQTRCWCHEQPGAAAAMWHVPVRPQTAVSLAGRGLPLHHLAAPPTDPPKNRASERGVRGAEESCPTSEHTRLTEQRLITTGKVFGWKATTTQRPKNFPGCCYQALVRAALMPEVQHQWGAGQPSPAAQQKRHTAPARVLCRRARPAPGRRTGSAPRPCRRPGGAGRAPGHGTIPTPAEQPLVRFPQVCIAWARERAGGRPQLGGQGDTCPVPLRLQRAAPRGQGWALSRTAMHTLERREERERKGRGRGVYTFENCQPCRVMGDPNRITRQTRILPSILK